jgi:hypothetical protein
MAADDRQRVDAVAIPVERAVDHDADLDRLIRGDGPGERAAGPLLGDLPRRGRVVCPWFGTDLIGMT